MLEPVEKWINVNDLCEILRQHYKSRAAHIEAAYINYEPEQAINAGGQLGIKFTLFGKKGKQK